MVVEKRKKFGKKINNFSRLKDRYLLLNKLKTIKNSMKFYQLFILQLRSLTFDLNLLLMTFFITCTTFILISKLLSLLILLV